MTVICWKTRFPLNKRIRTTAVEMTKLSTR